MAASKVIQHNPALYVGAAACYHYDGHFVNNNLSRVSRFGDPISLFKKISDGGQDYMLLPRAMCPDPVGDLDHREGGGLVNFKLQNFKPRNQQQVDVLGASIPKVKSGDSFIIQAGTGVGKTVMAMALIEARSVRTLIVVDQENIKTQWYKAIETFLGIPREKVGLIQGDVCRVDGCDIAIAMVHSLSKEDRYPTWVYEYFGMAIFDEVHIMGAETFQQCMWKLTAMVRVGLSATPRRKDGKDVVFLSHIGPVSVVSEAAPMIPKIILANSGWRCPVVGKNVDGTPQKLPHQAGKCTHVLKMLTKNSYRTEIIANFVKQAYDAGRNTVVFSELKEAYIPLLKAAFIKTGIPVKDIGMYVGGMKEDALSKASAKPVVLTTYRMTAKAVDCPWWDTAVFATPRSDVIQIAGRILREYEGKVCARSGTEGRVPVIFDVVDYDSPVFKQYFKGRGKYYRKIGAPMAGDTALLNSL